MRKEQNDNIKKFKYVPKKKKKKKTLWIFILIIIVASVVLLFKLPYFNVSNIVVLGNNYYDSNQVIESSNIQIGENAFYQLFFVGNKFLFKLPYVEDAKLSISFPNTIKIKITERESSYYAFDKEKNVYYRLDSKGYILEESTERKENEIIVNGFTFDNEVKFGEKINEIDLAKLSVYETIRDYYNGSNLKLKITKVAFENSLTTITLNDKLSVVFPNTTNLKYNIAFLEGIIKNIGEDSYGIVDLSKENPTFSNF